MSLWESAAAAGREAQLAVRGTSVLYCPANPLGKEVEVVGILTNPRAVADVWPGQYHGLEVLASGPAGGAQRGDTIIIGSVVFTVFDIANPGDGFVKLRLSKEEYPIA